MNFWLIVVIIFIIFAIILWFLPFECESTVINLENCYCNSTLCKNIFGNKLYGEECSRCEFIFNSTKAS
ncbi:MAG: hypothetical protein QW609_02410 [Candidatus Aenigmatarchaeota archaeon]